MSQGGDSVPKLGCPSVVCVFMCAIAESCFPVDWRLLEEEHRDNIKIHIDIVWYLLFSSVWRFDFKKKVCWSLQISLLSIMWLWLWLLALVTGERWHDTCNIWHMTHYIWLMICDTWHMVFRIKISFIWLFGYLVISVIRSGKRKPILKETPVTIVTQVEINTMCIEHT